MARRTPTRRRRIILPSRERMLLALYRAAPAATRQVVSGLLFNSFSAPLPEHAKQTSASFVAAIRDLELGQTGVKTLMSHCVPAMEKP